MALMLWLSFLLSTLLKLGAAHAEGLLPHAMSLSNELGNPSMEWVSFDFDLGEDQFELIPSSEPSTEPPQAEPPQAEPPQQETPQPEPEMEAEVPVSPSPLLVPELDLNPVLQPLNPSQDGPMFAPGVDSMENPPFEGAPEPVLAPDSNTFEGRTSEPWTGEESTETRRSSVFSNDRGEELRENEDVGEGEGRAGQRKAGMSGASTAMTVILCIVLAGAASYGGLRWYRKRRNRSGNYWEPYRVEMTQRLY